MIDDKGYYFNGLDLTVFWIGICGCVIYVICLLCIWICGWKDKKDKGYASVTYNNAWFILFLKTHSVSIGQLTLINESY